METVAGVRRVGPGMDHLEVRPQLGDLREVHAAVPTPRGIVDIRHTVSENGTLRTVVNAPEGVRVDICE